MMSISHGLVRRAEWGHHHRNPISPFLHISKSGEVTHGLQKGPLQVRRWRASKARHRSPRICGRDGYARTDVTPALRNKLISPQPHIPLPNLVPEALARVLTSSSHIRRRRRKEKCREINMSNERGLFRLFFLLLLLIRHRSLADGQDGLGGIGCGIFGAHTQQKRF